MSRVELIRVPGLAEVPYAYAATAPAGTRFVFLAGACPLDDAGAVTPVGDLEGQTRQALSTLRAALDAAGCALEDVVRTRVLVATTDREELGRAWAVVAESFGEHDVPSTLLGVMVLGWPGQLVEIEAVAAAPDGPTGGRNEKNPC